MYEVLKVYKEDLNYANQAGIVKADCTMGGLVVNLVAIKAADVFKPTTVTIKQGDTKDGVTEECGVFVSKQAKNVRAGDVIASFMLPWNVKKYVTATLSGTGSGETASAGETTNARVTLGYLPR